MASDEKSILVGVDFSEGSERALEQAVTLALGLRARVHVVHVYEPIAMVAPEAVLLTGEVQGQMEAERQQRTTMLAEWAQRLVGDRVPCVTHVIDGASLDGMLEEIRRVKPELVVVGSHGRGALMRMLMGSVSTALCHRSPVPVVVVPPAPKGAAS